MSNIILLSFANDGSLSEKELDNLPKGLIKNENEIKALLGEKEAENAGQRLCNLLTNSPIAEKVGSKNISLESARFLLGDSTTEKCSKLEHYFPESFFLVRELTGKMYLYPRDIFKAIAERIIKVNEEYRTIYHVNNPQISLTAPVVSTAEKEKKNKGNLRYRF